MNEQSLGAGQRPVRRVLIGVSDKTGLSELGTGLHAAGVEIVSTGGTAQVLVEAGVPVTPVEEITGFPESFDGRVKTLHPGVHAGLLADPNRDEHAEQLRELGISPFDLLVVNLYPFRHTVETETDPEVCVENIDIGGPAMVRAAAKNHDHVAVVVDPARYGWVLERVQAGGFEQVERKRLAADAFAHTAAYDAAVAAWFAESYASADNTGLPAFLGTTWQRDQVLRYGENPHQQAAVYLDPRGGLAHAEQLHGKAMSYNNYVDADAAWNAVSDFSGTAVAIIKHTNPCGTALGFNVAEAHRKAYSCDPVSAFGGVVATNRPVDLAAAEQIADVFTEVVLAPGFDPEALEVLTRKQNVRLLRLPESSSPESLGFRPISGGMLVQTRDRIDAPGDDSASWTLVAGEAADEHTLADLEFAWRAGRSVKSNAVLLAHDTTTVGVGMGQVNRVDSARLAVQRAGDRASGSVAASDGFFPFPDGLQILLDAGVRAVVQPGGSIRDAEVIAAAEAAGTTLYLTGTRHFTH